jgi:hypothetical protein
MSLETTWKVKFADSQQHHLLYETICHEFKCDFISLPLRLYISGSLKELSPEVIATDMAFTSSCLNFSWHYTSLTTVERVYNSAIASQPSMASPHSYLIHYASVPITDFLGFVYVAEVLM